MATHTATIELSAGLVHNLTATASETVAVIAPFTGDVLHNLPQSTADDVAQAASAARAAQRDWLAAGFRHRRAVLLRAHDLLLERQEAILDLLQTETGKTRGQAFEEVSISASVTRYCAISTHRVLATKRRRAAVPLVTKTRVSYEPKGVVGVITPWNYPVALGVMDVIPAIATGNGVVQKIDNQTALSMLATRRAYIDAGVPTALWAIVAGPGEIVGNAVVDAADYVCFTGSTPTGIRVAQRAAARLVGASLELGGKNAMLVLDDADPMDAASKAVYACFTSMGQLCVSIERIYVDRRVAEVFIPEFARKTRALVLGSAFDYSTDVGSLTSAAQLERITAKVGDAVAKGATVLAGGKARPELGPYFFEPTVLTNVTPAMECFAAETFGPVVAVTIVDSEAEAIAAANDTEFGLNASVFTGSVARGRRVADQLNTGSVNINEGYRGSFGSVDAPMGGMKKSGLGRRNGVEGMTRFVDARTVAELTGLLALPTTGRHFERLVGPLVLLAKVLKAIRRA